MWKSVRGFCQDLSARGFQATANPQVQNVFVCGVKVFVNHVIAIGKQFGVIEESYGDVYGPLMRGDGRRGKHLMVTATEGKKKIHGERSLH